MTAFIKIVSLITCRILALQSLNIVLYTVFTGGGVAVYLQSLLSVTKVGNSCNVALNRSPYKPSRCTRGLGNCCIAFTSKRPLYHTLNKEKKELIFYNSIVIIILLKSTELLKLLLFRLIYGDSVL